MVNGLLKALPLLICMVISTNAHALSTDSSHAILFDYSSGDTLFNKNADNQMYPSSMTKLMTVYVALKKARNGEFDLNKKYTISKKAWQMKGSKMFLNQGEEVPGIELVKGVIILSGNDAAVALSEAIAGSESKFATLMNAEAKSLGLNNTNFVNASGLTAKNHYMSAADIALLSTKLLEEFSEYFDIFSMAEYSYANITQPNRNSLLAEPGVDGLKTGSTDAGGYGLAFTAEREGRRVIGVVNGLKTPVKRHQEAKKLLDHAYNDFTFHKVANKEEKVIEIPVHYGVYSTVGAISRQNIGITQDKEKPEGFEVKVKFEGPLIAPVEQNKQIAILVIKKGDNEKQIPLYAEREVAKTGILGKFYQNILYRVGNLLK